MQIKVECHAGYRGDQYPKRFILGEKVLEIREVADQWYSPSFRYFRVLADDDATYVLRHDEAHDVWTLEAFRRTP